MSSKSWNKKYHVESSMKNDDKGYAMFLGRWQPLHEGHKQLFSQVLDSGKRLCIMIRDMPTNEKNPYTAQEVKSSLELYYNDYVQKGEVVVMVVPNITSINFGRGVGYDIVEHIPPSDIAEISATKVRNGLIDVDGKPKTSHS